MMRATWKRFLILSAAVAALSSLSGCVVVNGEHEGDLTFSWTCDGYHCRDQDVASVVVEIYYPHGGSLVDSVESSSDATGVSLTDLEDGVYDYHIVGLSLNRRVYYESYGTADVHGGTDNVYDVRLAYVP